MKLTVEIKGNSFCYAYEIGECKHSSTSHLSAELLEAFVGVLSHCSQVTRKQMDDHFGEIKGKAWIEKNKNEAALFLKKIQEL